MELLIYDTILFLVLVFKCCFVIEIPIKTGMSGISRKTRYKKLKHIFFKCNLMEANEANFTLERKIIFTVVKMIFLCYK